MYKTSHNSITSTELYRAVINNKIFHITDSKLNKVRFGFTIIYVK